MDNSSPNNNPNMPKMPKFNMNWLYVLVIIALGVVFFAGGNSFLSSSAGVDRDYTTFKQYIAKGYGTKVVINKSDNTLRMYVSPDHIRDIFKQGTQQVGKSPYVNVEIGSVDKVETFLDQAVAQKKIASYSYENKSGNGFMDILISIAPWVFFFGIWYFLIRRMGGGAGGGGGVTYSYTSAPHAKHFPAVLDASVTNFYHPTDPPIRSFAGSGLSTRGGDATTGTQFYTHSLNTKVSVEGGKGGNNGAGGAGAAKPEVPTGSPNHIFSYDSQNNQVLYSSSTAGNAGGSGFKAKGGNGAVAYSYQLDNNDPKNLEVLTLPGGERIEFSAEETAAEFNGYQFAMSGGGGGGYGGGGSGAALALSAITTIQKWNNNPAGIRQSVSYLQFSGAGGAGGSYLSPRVIEGEISNSMNAMRTGINVHDGEAKVYLCETKG